MKIEDGQCTDGEVHDSHQWLKTWGTWTIMICVGLAVARRVTRTVSAVERAFGADYSRAFRETGGDPDFRDPGPRYGRRT